MSKIDEVMKAWQEDHQKVSWQDLQTLKAENETLRAQLSEKNIGQGEPVAWIRPSGKAMLEAGGYCTVYASNGMSNHSTPLYTHPAPQQKPLTDERAESSVDYWQQRGYLGNSDEWREACRLFRVRCSTEDIERMAKLRTYIEDGLLLVLTPTEPQQKPLTDEQIVDAARACYIDVTQDNEDSVCAFARAIESAHNIGEKK